MVVGDTSSHVIPRTGIHRQVRCQYPEYRQGLPGIRGINLDGFLGSGTSEDPPKFLWKDGPMDLQPRDLDST